MTHIYKVGDIVEILPESESTEAFILGGINEIHAGLHVKVQEVQSAALGSPSPQLLRVDIPGDEGSSYWAHYSGRFKPVVPGAANGDALHLVVDLDVQGTEAIRRVLGGTQEIHKVVSKTWAPPRPYDFARGDVRRYDDKAALKVAFDAARERQTPMTIRLSGPALDGGRPLYLIQEA